MKAPSTEIIKAEFVSYQIARQLEAIGFNEECMAVIDQTEFLHIKGTKYPIRGAMFYDERNCPLIQQVFKWFREKHGWHCRHVHNNLGYTFFGKRNRRGVFSFYTHPHAEKYEDAQLSCIKKLIEITVEDISQTKN